MLRLIPLRYLTKTRALVLCSLTLVAFGAFAAVDKALLEQAQALIKAGKAQEAYQMLESKEDEHAGDLMFDYLLGTAALESGKPSKATFVYERMLAIDPSYIGVRADMGRAYFALGDYGRAKIEFETVLGSQNLPSDLRTQVEQYSVAADSRAQAKPTTMTSYLEVGFGQDNNIGSASGLTVLNLPATGVYRPTAPTGTKIPDEYSTLALGGEINHMLSEKWGLMGGLDYRSRDYAKYNEPNTWTWDARAGVTYTGGAWLLRTMLTAGEYTYNSQRLRQTLGATADWRMALTTSSQLLASGSVLRAGYVPAASKSQESDTYTGTLGWMKVLGAGGTALNLSAVFGQENATGARDDGDRRFWGARALVQSSFTKDVGGYLTAGWTQSDFSGINSSYLMARHEIASDVTAALNLTLTKGVALRPQISYVKNHSNAALYAYEKVDASVNLRFDY